MERKTKIAIGLGLVAAYLLFRQRGAIVNILGQAYDAHGNATSWSERKLGFGTSSIGGGGCILTALTTAFNTFNPDSPLTPDIANDILKTQGAFLAGSSAMVIEKGANALGMQLPTAQHLQPANGLSIKGVLDAALAGGGFALLRVFHGSDPSGGDHTVLVTGGGGGTYVAADPALARMVTFNLVGNDLISQDGTKWGGHVPYKAVGVAALYNS